MSIEDKEGRHGRSVRLTTSINTRLITLCEHLGVTPNAYLVQAIGKAITQDEMHFKVGQSNDSLMQMMAAFQGQVSELMTPQEPSEEKQLTLDQDS
jgi:hypothetical protein